MPLRTRVSLMAGAFALAVASLGISALFDTAPSAAPAPLVVIVMENHEYGAIVGSSSAPYLNEIFIPAGRLFTNYHAITHPSLPNYLAMTAGKTLCSDNDCARPFTSAKSIFKQLQKAQIGWRAWAESMPSNCDPDNSGLYAVRHNPPPYFSNLVKACKAKNTPYPSPLPPLRPFTFITPNVCSDMHDCSVSTGDTWLKNHVPPLLNKGAEVVIVFDEGSTSDGGGGHVMAAEVGPGVSEGITDSGSFNHYSLLAGLEDRFGVPRLGNAAGKTALPL